MTKWEKIRHCISRVQEIDRHFAVLSEVAGCTPDSPLFDAVFRMRSDYIQEVETVCGCPGDISRFCHDNGYGPGVIVARDIDDLLAIIAEANA